jgi:hypothetical protein
MKKIPCVTRTTASTTVGIFGLSILLVLSICACGDEVVGATSPGGITTSTAAVPSVVTRTSTAPGAQSLLSMLAGIPQVPVAQSDEGFIYFVDYSAWKSVYGVTSPADYAEFDNDDAWDTATTAWWALFFDAPWHPSQQYWLLFVAEGPETVGFSPLEIERAVEFGVPPSSGLTLEGEFDAGAISAAYENNFALTPKTFDGTTVWCWGDDPDAGLKLDPANREPANPFGGELGRRQPMIISDDLAMSSADLDVVLACATARAGEVSSLADAPAYFSAVDAVAEDADILQATIAGPAMTRGLATMGLSELAGGLFAPEEIGDYVDSLLQDYMELPAYELLLLADVATANEQIVRLALVFADAESAETAGTVLLHRLGTYESFVRKTPLEEMLDSWGVGDTRFHVRQSSGQAVLVLEFPAPRLTLEEIAGTFGEDRTIIQGFLYGRFVNMFNNHDTVWLSTATRAELEALR